MIDSASPRVLSAVVLLSLIWFGSTPPLTFGQTPVAAFEELNTRVKVGDSLKVIDRDGREASGRVVGITPDAIVLDGPAPRTFTAGGVARVQKPGGRRVAKGAAWGSVIGAGLGTALAMATREDSWTLKPGGCPPHQGPPPQSCILETHTTTYWSLIPIVASLGAGVGAAIGSLVPGNWRDVLVTRPGGTAAGRVGRETREAPAVPGAAVWTPEQETRVRSGSEAGLQSVTMFERLNTRLTAGSTLWITDTGGRVLKGTLAGLSPTSIRLAGQPRTVEFSAAQVVKIEMAERDPVTNGLGWGALAGLGGGMLVGMAAGKMADCEGQDDCVGPGGLALVFGLIGGGVGMAAGAAVDGVTPGPRTAVYVAKAGSRPTPDSAHVTVAPVVTRRGGGLMIGVRF